MKLVLLRAAVAVALGSILVPAIAQDHSAHMHGAAAKPAAQSLSEGTIKKLDAAAGKLTIAHGPIENLGMPAMTMSFAYAKGVVPSAVKEGDRIRFRAEEKDGRYVVVRVEAAK